MGAETFNDRVMKDNIVIGDIVWEVVSSHCPEAGRSVNEKEEFYEPMDKVVTSEMLVGGDFNGHVGKDTGCFGDVHSGFGIGQINDGVSDCWTGLCLMNTCFQKSKTPPMTFRLCETETIIDYIFVNN